MITLASYPRSGNTFLRNVLFEVYGISSGTFLLDGHGPDAEWETFSVVKTHHLPAELPEKLRQRPAVYLLRDGRDSLVSFAHHRKDIVAIGSDYRQNLKEAIYAAEGSHFGGWSTHVELWAAKAAIIIRFEDLIADPIGQCERLRAVMDLPPPSRERLPNFQSLKQGTPEYGAGKEVLESKEAQMALANKWFRRGKIGAWKDELPQDMHDLFWHLHGETMEVAGYGLTGDVHAFPLLGSRFTHREPQPKVSVHVEATKVLDPFVDGIKRYVVELLRTYQKYSPQEFEFQALIANEHWDLPSALEKDGRGHGPLNAGFWSVLKNALKWLLPAVFYNRLAKSLPLPVLLSKLRFRDNSRPQASAGMMNGTAQLLHLTLPQNHHFTEAFEGAVVATVHDMTHVAQPQFHEQNNIRLAANGMEWIAQHNASIIAVSESTKSDLQRVGLSSEKVLLGVDRKRFYPIPNQHLLELVRERYELPSTDFLLSVSTLEPRKNIRSTIQAYAALPASVRVHCHLVLTGKKGWKWTELNVPDQCQSQIHFTGFVREDHLPALYTQALAFCYVSHYEGFGLPVLEAMACGTPVIASNVSSLPEVVGEAGLLCAPDDVPGIGARMEQVITDSTLRESLSQKAIKRSWEFTWSRTAEQTLAVYLNARNSGSQRS